MSRVGPKPLNEYPWYLRILFFFQKRRYGATLEPSLIWGRSPPLFLAFRGFSKALDRDSSPLQADLRALVAARVSQVRQSSFCIDIHSWMALRHGVGQAKLLALAACQYSPLFTLRERAALRYAEALAISDTVSDQVFVDLRNQFSDDEVVELTALICFQCMSSKFNSALDIPSQGFLQGTTESHGLFEAIMGPEAGACGAEPRVVPRSK